MWDSMAGPRIVADSAVRAELGRSPASSRQGVTATEVWPSAVRTVRPSRRMSATMRSLPSSSSARRCVAPRRSASDAIASVSSLPIPTPCWASSTTTPSSATAVSSSATSATPTISSLWPIIAAATTTSRSRGSKKVKWRIRVSEVFGMATKKRRWRVRSLRPSKERLHPQRVARPRQAKAYAKAVVHLMGGREQRAGIGESRGHESP